MAPEQDGCRIVFEKTGNVFRGHLAHHAGKAQFFHKGQGMGEQQCSVPQQKRQVAQIIDRGTGNGIFRRAGTRQGQGMIVVAPDRRYFVVPREPDLIRI